MRLGPFDLETPIGKGGMGEIWRAVHERQRVPVAIKVDLHPPDGQYDAAFLHEVQLIAGLNHPNIVTILDHGTVPAIEAQRSNKRLTAGARYLAMELAGGGSLADHTATCWGEVRHIALELLDALSHAHAHGIVHRDIKPGNLLLAGPRARTASVPDGILDARIVLSDFGISHLLETTGEAEAIGTPLYMAPEQVEGRWRDQGPWTDLYAVGILLWRTCTGRHPLKFRNTFQLFRAHILQEPGVFEQRMAVPEGLEDLCRRLLNKHPSERYAFAADARRALMELGPPVGLDGSFHGDSIHDDAVTEAVTIRHAAVTGTAMVVTADSTTTWVPQSWRTDGHASLRNRQLEGVGLALYGVRAIPLIGRALERDVLWGEFVQVRSTARVRVVLLRGPAGAGKTRLASWMAHRAHEVGAAITLKVSHAPEPDGEHGLVRMIARHLKTDLLTPDEVDVRVQTLFEASNVDTHLLSRLLGGHLGEERVNPGRRELHRLVERVLHHLAGRGALILWLDDAQFARDTLEFVEHLISVATQRPISLLVLVNVQDEALADRLIEREIIDDLSDKLTTLPIRALDDGEHRELVRELLGLDGALAVRVEQKTAGNPSFAIQLVGSWVEQGLLVPSDRGFKLEKGIEAEIPDDLFTVWEHRLERLLSGLPDEDREALEAAAVLGHEVDRADWLATCALLEIEPSSTLVRRALERHLLRAGEEGLRQLSFVHALLRECLLNSARAGGRWQDLHLAAGVHLREIGRAAPERLARHFMEAEVFEEALEPLETAAADRFDRGDFRSTDHVDGLEHAIGRLALPSSSPWWGRLWLLRCWRERRQRNHKEAERFAMKTERAARRHGWDLELARALRESARVAHLMAEVDESIALITEAEQRFLALGDDDRAATCKITRGDYLTHRNQLDEAELCYREAIPLFDARSNRLAAHGPYLGLALIARKRNDLETLRHWIAECRTRAEESGNLGVLATAANLEGEAARAAGETELAEQCYREAARRYAETDDPEGTFPLLNLGVLLIDRGAWEDARQAIEPLLTVLLAEDNQVLAAFARSVLLPALCALDEVHAARQHLGELEDFLQRTGMKEKDIAHLAEVAGNEATDRRLTDRAHAIAIAQYEGIKKPEEAARIRAGRTARR